MMKRQGVKRKSSILLIAPRYNITNKVDYNYVFPLGLGYISSTLKNSGYDVTCLNLNHCNGTIQGIIKKELDKKEYAFVGTGHMGIGYVIVKSIIESVRNHKSKPKFILGGAIITSEPELMFNSLAPDFAVLGEGEKTILDLLDCLKNQKNIKKIKGIMYRDSNGKLIITEKREPIEKIDKIPVPDFEGFGFKEQLKHMHPNMFYWNNQFDYPRTYSILCSRSCPFRCTFCYHSIGNKYRERSLENIRSEIKNAIEKYNLNCIAIYDDLFSYNRERLYKFCEMIKELQEKTGKKLKWTCQLSVNTVNKDMLEMMKDAGCDIVSYGFESFDEGVLRSMKKPITPEQIDYALRTTLNAKMSVQGNFIFGDVAETKESATKTLDYWKKYCYDQVGLYFVQPYPGSELYSMCVKKRIIKDKLNFIENEMNKEVVLNMTENMTDEEINQLYQEILNARVKYGRFVSPSFMKRIDENIYEVRVTCPFCKETNTYKNFFITNRIFFNDYMICRSCNMRFRVVSSIRKLSKRFNLLLRIARKCYIRYLSIKRNIFKNKVLAKTKNK